MSKELVLEKLESLGFSVVDAHKFGYVFEYEELTFLYMPDDDENFLRFALPNIFDVTTENRSFVLALSLEITTFLSSIGPRRASITLRGICAASSRNSTPFCARLTSPGIMLSPAPPPMIAAREAE